MPRSDYWIKIFDSLPGHWKTRHIQKAMKWSRFETVGFLTMFWLQVASDAPDGVLDGLVSVNDILKAIGLKDKSRKVKCQFFQIVQALLGCNLLEESEDGFVLHDWEDGGGKLQKTRAGDNSRQRQRRSRSREDDPPECHADVTDESKSKEVETPPYPPQAGGEFKFFEKLVLDIWAAECQACGMKAGKDSKTALGAGKVAKALVAGDLAREDLQPSLRGFLARVTSDPAKATWDLNTYAKKPTSYLPIVAPASRKSPPPAPKEPEVMWRWRCDTCGREVDLPSPASEGRPPPSRCFRGVHCVGTMHVVEDVMEGESVAAS